MNDWRHTDDWKKDGIGSTTHRHRAGQAIPDDGSLWRSLGERQNCTAETFHDSRPPLDHTGSAHLIGEGSDSHPGPVQMYGPERMRAPRWLVFAAFFAVGWFAEDALHAVAKLWAKLP